MILKRNWALDSLKQPLSWYFKDVYETVIVLGVGQNSLFNFHSIQITVPNKLTGPVKVLKNDSQDLTDRQQGCFVILH